MMETLASPFIFTVVLIGTASIINLLMHRGSPVGERPRLNWALMCVFALLAAVSLACIPYGVIPGIVCAGIQIAAIGLTEIRSRKSDPDAGLWYPSRRDGLQDTAVSGAYVVTMMIELISLAVSS